MSTQLPARPVCSSCGSTKVGTLAKEITKDTLWRCASCGETFKAPATRVATTRFARGA
jgi:ribosomal protein L37AE/L43A